jgi:hypothetical protein
MQRVRGSNPLSSTPGQRPSPSSITRESPSSGSKSAAICPEGPIQRPGRRCRRPTSLASSRGRSGPPLAGRWARRRTGSAGTARSSAAVNLVARPATFALSRRSPNRQSRRRHVRLDLAHDRPRHQQPAGHDLEGPRSAMGIQAVAIERCSDLAEPLCAQLAPVWELVASIPAPRSDHRQHEDPALA